MRTALITVDFSSEADKELLESARKVLGEMGLTVEQACELFISNVTADNLSDWLGTSY